MPALTTVGAVVLSMGNRPVELEKALDTLLAQRGVDLDVVLVGNGWRPEGLPDRVRTVHLEENVGIPEGRNVGAREAVGDILFFYDDDAVLPTDDVVARLAHEFELDERIAVVQPRGVDPGGRPTPRRWIPRLRTGAGGAPGDVVVFWEGVCAIRRSAFEEVGRLAGPLLVRPRGHRPRLPPARRRLAAALPARHRRQPPGDAAVTSRGLLPDERPQPRVGRQTQPPAPGRRALPHDVVAHLRRAHP